MPEEEKKEDPISELPDQKEDENEKKRLADEEEENFKIKSAISLSSPEAVVMLMIAGLIDLMGILLLFIGLDDFGILDIIGMVFIGSWMFFRFGHAPNRIKNKKIGKNLGKRLGLTFLTEIIPYLGSIMPTWFLAVFFELKNNPN